MCALFGSLGITGAFGCLRVPCHFLSGAFVPQTLQRAVIVYKISGVDNESEASRTAFALNQTNCNRQLNGHENQCRIVDELIHYFKKYGVEASAVNKKGYDFAYAKCSDIVVSVGGDGTFLSAALKILENHKPIIGINSCPISSEGSLCLPRHWHTNISTIVDRIMTGKFKVLRRQRIRLRVSTPPDQLTHLDEIFPRHLDSQGSVSHLHPVAGPKTETTTATSSSTMYLLPVRALNEVFISACMSARVSEYLISLDDGPQARQKSSGLLVCTGTGSSSWYSSMNQVDASLVSQLLSLAGEKRTPDDVASIVERFNRGLLFDAASPNMAYSVREVVKNHVFKFDSPRGFAKKIRLISCMNDAYLSIDGWLSIPFENGACVELSIDPEDALSVIDFPDST
uniref:NAD(+) kinase n=2 Tax=Mesocestoides corti TaxID=53468 RepID=A0A5K3FVU8_MESCO